MINFKTLRWKNLLSTGNHFTEINLDTNTNTLIVGENGSGKSTMLDALCFVLFGKAFRNINKPQLLNSINGKDCVVEIEFETGNKSYKVIRGIKPNKFEIYCDNQLLNQDAASRDYQELLEKFILKLNYKSFTQIVILGSASFTPFMQLSASDRRAIIEDLLDIQIFSTMNGLVKERISNNKDLIGENKHKIEMTNQKKELIKKHIEELKQNNHKEIKKHEEDIKNNMEVISNINEDNIHIIKEIEEKQKSVEEKNSIETKIKKISKLESQIENNLSKYKKDTDFFSMTDDCPTCKQNIPSNVKEQELKKLTTKIDECELGLKQLSEKIDIEHGRLDEINAILKSIHTLQVKVATNNTSINEINKYILKLQNNIDKLQSSTSVSNKEENELTTIQDLLIQFEQELKTLIDEKQYYEIASSLLKDTGIKTKIVKQYLPIINKLVNKYLASLDFFVNFNLDDSFKETIKSRHRDDFTYNNFSEGEKAKINLALLFTWRAISKLKNSNSTNLLILDEIVDSALDYNGIDNFLKLLKEITDDTSVFVISPKGDTYQDKFHSVIRFKKEKNFSKMKIT